MNQPTKPKGKPRGRKGGRKPALVPHKRINVYLSQPDLDKLATINPSPSQAIRTLIKEKQDK
jgi:hypothetical protein